MAELMTADEYDQLVEQHGATYAAMEGADRMLRQWLESHPEDNRSIEEIFSDPEFTGERK